MKTQEMEGQGVGRAFCFEAELVDLFLVISPTLALNSGEGQVTFRRESILHGKSGVPAIFHGFTM